MMPADLIYALSDDRQRAALNRARDERIAEHNRRQGARSRRTRERTS